MTEILFFFFFLLGPVGQGSESELIELRRIM